MTNTKHEYTFLYQPRDNAKKYDFTYIGIPMNTSHDEDGIKYAPSKIRELSQRYSNADGSAQPLKLYNPSKGYLLDGITIRDAGDIIIDDSLPIEGIDKHIADIINSIKSNESIPISIGGDHYITYPILKGFGGKITVVQFDAHGDYLDEPDYLHGSVMRYISTLPHVDRIIHCGLRGNLNTGPGLEDSLKDGNIIITDQELLGRDQNILSQHINTNDIYLSFDTDFLNPSIAPGTGFPEPGGLDYYSAIHLISDLCNNHRVVGMDISEYIPTKDSSDLTGIHLTNLIIDSMPLIKKSTKN